MWFIGGSKTKFRLVKEGRTVEAHCEDCDKVVTFRECEVTDKLHAFFIDVYETSARRMVCGECGEDHDVDEFFVALRARERRAIGSGPPRAALAPAASRAPALPPPTEAHDIEDELAALKRRLGKA